MVELNPQCTGGVIPPFILADGQVLPCCMIQAQPETYNMHGNIVHNPLSTNPNFNIHNNPYLEILASDEWNQMMDDLGVFEMYTCNRWCNKNNNNKTVPYAPDEDGYTFDGNRTDILQLELTNVCNLRCPYCERITTPHRVNRDQMPIDVAWRVMQEKHWDRHIDCGKYGDPLWYIHMEELLNRMIKKPTMNHYAVSHAATGKPKEYWEKIIGLWAKLNEKGVSINPIFGIDGLEETSKKNRVNQNWEEIVYALRYTADNTDITPTLQFIPFKWNQHELDYMWLLAEKWGADFVIVKSARFPEDDPNRPDEGLFTDA